MDVRQIDAGQIYSYPQQAQQIHGNLLDVELLQSLVFNYGNNVRIEVVLIEVVVYVLVVPDNHVYVV